MDYCARSAIWLPDRSAHGLGLGRSGPPPALRTAAAQGGRNVEIIGLHLDGMTVLVSLMLVFVFVPLVVAFYFRDLF